MTDRLQGAADRPGATARSVMVAVLTYRRPDDLVAVLPLLVRQVAELGCGGEVLVVDNDPDGGARAVVDPRRAAPSVRYVHEPQPGIAAARNRALAEAESAQVDLLVFIDDDERPVEDWLRLLVETYERHRPAAVVGPVVSEFAVPPEAWIRAGRFFDRRRLPTGTEVMIAATNNLLLDVAQVRTLGLTFDERFGISGGSDMLLTRRLTAAGGRMVWCDEAIVIDVVPADRSSRTWVLRRAYRSGNTWARTSIVLADGAIARTLTRGRLCLQGGVRVVAGALRMAVGTVVVSMVHRARGRRTLARGAGMLSGAIGIVYVEYGRGGRAVVRESRLTAAP